jgi:hypothetical protein
LSDLVYSRLFRDVLWSWRFRLENVSLQFHFCLICLGFTLFSQEVGQVYLNPRRRAWSQIVRRRSVLGLLEFHELRFDHLNFLLLSFFFDSLVLLLRRVQILLQNVLVVSVSSEDPLVVHNVESLAAFLLLWDGRKKHSILGSLYLCLSLTTAGGAPSNDCDIFNSTVS